jgi:hypothetical protein
MVTCFLTSSRLVVTIGKNRKRQIVIIRTSVFAAPAHRDTDCGAAGHAQVNRRQGG